MNQVSRALLATSGASGPQTYVDDVFSTYLYTGNGAAQTFNIGIDLAGKGGLVWAKNRDGAFNHRLVDTLRGGNLTLYSNSASAQGTEQTINTFSSTGFSVGTFLSANLSNYVAWTFRKAPKFFDLVSYTGNAAARTIAHSLGVAPGTILIKRTDVSGPWSVYHRSLAVTEYLALESTAAAAAGGAIWDNTPATSTDFSLGAAAIVNAAGGSYIAYLFAHDTASDGLIQCGSFTTNASGSATVSLGWEPQWLLMKAANASGDWNMFDVMRGMPVGGNDSFIGANVTTVESSAADYVAPTATGFDITNFGNTLTWVYIAIRRPNKPPTTGTSVFNAVTYPGDSTTNRVVNVSITPDTVIGRYRDLTYAWVADRLRPAATNLQVAPGGPAELANRDIRQLGQNSVTVSFINGGLNVSGFNDILWCFRRAPGFFDVVCYSGTSANRTVSHNLGAVPELMIIKNRSATAPYAVYSAAVGATTALFLDDAGTGTTSSFYFNDTAPTSSAFTVGISGQTNGSSFNYIAYLFASLPGISKVGSYTGNGSVQGLNCGFTTGARFVLIKRRDSTGDWYVWDTARGIINAGNDPHLSLNNNTAEVTTDNSIEPTTAGFQVNQVAATNINVNAATYIYLAIA